MHGNEMNCYLWDAVAHQFSIARGTVEHTQRDGFGDTLRLVNHCLHVWHVVSVFKRCVIFSSQDFINLLLAFFYKRNQKKHNECHDKHLSQLYHLNFSERGDGTVVNSWLRP